MKLLMVVLALVTSVGLALAQDPEPDTIGLWFDESATVNVINGPYVLQQFNAYLVIHAPTHGEIAGLECAIDVPEGVFCTEMHCPPGYISWGDLYNVIVTWNPALDPDPDLLVITFDYLVLTVPDLPAFFTLGPTTPSSFPETTSPGYAYLVGLEPLLQPLDYVHGDPSLARMEGGTVAIEARSLSEVKSLFE